MDTKGYQSRNEITAYPSAELAVEAMKPGAADYLIKPVGLMTWRGLSGRLSLKAKVDIRRARACFCSEGLYGATQLLDIP
jgi:DNA-binding NtrC family response regulator